jgi:hypothetical protein
MQVVPATHVPDPDQPIPPHCEYFGSVPPVLVLVDVAEELVAVAVTDPPRRLMTDVYAGLVLRSAFHRQASPSPENVLGIQEYLSVKSQSVMPTQSLVARQEPTVLR